jgi:CRISPR-associated protein Cas1
MESLYIDRRDTRLDVDGGALIVRHPEQARPFSLPLQNIRRVVVSCRLDFSSSVLQALTRSGVAMVILNPKTSDVCTVTLPWTHGHAERRVAQYRMLGDTGGRLIASRNLVAFKIAGQRRTVLRLLRNHPDARRPLTLAAARLADATAAALACPAVTALRGIEGAAAREYFAALGCCVSPELGFSGRNRRPPRDPVNAALSLSYAMLHAEAVRALCSVGLDPALGFFHELDYARESLACDLVEVLRPRVDLQVLRLFNTRVLRPDHFSTPADGACLMTKAGRGQFYPAWEASARVWRRALRRIARQWARQVLAAEPGPA